MFGSEQAVAEVTGSVPTPRFTGPQISKARLQPGFANTGRVSLVSSLLPSLFLGRIGPIDVADGSGMNLMNLRTRTWDARALAACEPAGDLAARLGQPVPSHQALGSVSRYFLARWDFAPSCLVVAGSGDNPCSLAGLALDPETTAVSLGTSDTLFGCLTNPQPSAEANVFCDPTDPATFMALLCFKNGARTREVWRERLACADWAEFNQLLASSEPGNGGNLGLLLEEEEIVPRLPAGQRRWDPQDQALPAFPRPVEARALIEGHFLSMFVHARRLGFRIRTILATGGASANPTLLQVLADVFQCQVCTIPSSNSAALGAALRALHGLACSEQASFVPFRSLVRPPPASGRVQPRPSLAATYLALADRLERLELAEQASLN